MKRRSFFGIPVAASAAPLAAWSMREAWPTQEELRLPDERQRALVRQLLADLIDRVERHFDCARGVPKAWAEAPGGRAYYATLRYRATCPMEEVEDGTSEFEASLALITALEQRFASIAADHAKAMVPGRPRLIWRLSDNVQLSERWAPENFESDELCLTIRTRCAFPGLKNFVGDAQGSDSFVVWRSR